MLEILTSSAKKFVKDLLKKVWAQSTSAGQFSLQYATAVVNGEIYILGGRVGLGTGARNTIYKYNKNGFTLVNNFPQNLVAICAAAVGNKIYVIGGTYSRANGQENKKVNIYDAVTNTLSQGTDMPVACVVGSCVAVGTDIYVYGGMANQNESGFPKLFYKYDTLTNTWTSLPYHDGQAMLSTSIIEFDGLLYAFGGEYNNATGNENDVRVFNPATNTWSKLVVAGTKPAPRGACSLVKYDEKRFVIVGGRAGSGTTCLADVWVFDIQTLAWTRLPDYPSRVSFHRAELIGDNDIAVFDGWNGGNVIAGVYRLQ